MEIPRYPPIAEDWFFSDKRVAYEMPLKGWVCIHVEVQEGKYHELCFYDPTRLRQTMESTIEDGEPCFTEYCPIVLIPSR
jgi:hypothetical protein